MSAGPGTSPIAAAGGAANPSLVPSMVTRRSSQVLGITLLGVWGWWALVRGGYFGTVLHPGSVVLYSALMVVVAFTPLPIARRGPHVVALFGLLGFAIWTAISLLWTAAPGQGLEDAQRVFLYSAAYLAGLILAITLGRRLLLSIVPLLGAGAVVGGVVIARLWLTHSAGPLLDEAGTMDFPFSYRNANGGFFVLVAICSAALLARRSGGAWPRAAAGGLVSMALSLAVICESRGSLLALAAGVLALLLATPDRGRTAIGLIASALPVGALFSQLAGPYNAHVDSLPVVPELHGAAEAAALATVLGAALTVGVLLLDRRFAASIRLPRRSRAVSQAAIWLTLVAAVVVVVAAIGNPIDRFERVITPSTQPADASAGSRFESTAGTNRKDFWRVSLDQFADHPIAGGGSGSFRAAYLRDRESDEQPRDAHSLPIETLGEVGIVGFAMLVVAAFGAVVAALRSRRLGPEAALLSTAALAGAASWGAQACVEWSWSFAGLTAPMIALLGSAAGASALALTPLRGPTRRFFLGFASVLALITIPTFAADRLTSDAAEGWRSDLDGAYRALDAASDLNPLSAEPELVKGEIARQNDDPSLALAALEQAREREPEDYQSYLIRAEVLEDLDPAGARTEIDRALELNPDSPEANEVRKRLRARPAKQTTPSEP
jgi:hypothetical protein